MEKDRVHLTRNDELIPGTWKPGLTSRTNGDGLRLTASIGCPDCGLVFSLSQHQIVHSGAVHPSVRCPYRGCFFHEWITLEGWIPET